MAPVPRPAGPRVRRPFPLNHRVKGIAVVLPDGRKERLEPGIVPFDHIGVPRPVAPGTPNEHSTARRHKPVNIGPVGTDRNR